MGFGASNKQGRVQAHGAMYPSQRHILPLTLKKYSSYFPNIGKYEINFTNVTGDRQMTSRLWGYQHTSYLSILEHHHIIEACKKYTKKCVNLRQNSQNWPKLLLLKLLYYKISSFSLISFVFFSLLLLKLGEIDDVKVLA